MITLLSCYAFNEATKELQTLKTAAELKANQEINHIPKWNVYLYTETGKIVKKWINITDKPHTIYTTTNSYLANQNNEPITDKDGFEIQAPIGWYLETEIQNNQKP